MTVRAIYILFLLLVWVGSISPAVALDTSATPNAKEMRIMPPFCVAKFTLAQGSPEWNAWRDRVGENFIDIHHYCFALVAVNRYWSSRSPQDRGFYLQRALLNYNYVVNAMKPDFTLGAELFSDRGALFMLMGKPGEAAKDFNKALSINPNFAKPYLQLADLHVAIKAPTHALETVTEGLRHLPDSTALQRRYLELGGKKPFPEPIIAKAAEPVLEKAIETTPAAETVIEPVPAPAPAASPTSEPAAASPSALPIGTHQNPYCRFCPPE
jgi:tetratricopeptide (TPR) repeat protein